MVVPWYHDSMITYSHESPGNLFDSPNGSALIHACNCMGKWGAGVAAAFQEQYPAAFEIYAQHCRARNWCGRAHQIVDVTPVTSRTHRSVRLPLGTALLIPPQASDIALHGRRHWIVCLFASHGYGRYRDPRDSIECSIYAALQDLSHQLREMRATSSQVSWPHLLFSNKFGSGYFNLPWTTTRNLIAMAGLHINVYSWVAPTPPLNPQAAPYQAVSDTPPAE